MISWLTDRLLQEANDSAVDSRSSYMFESRVSNFDGGLMGPGASSQFFSPNQAVRAAAASRASGIEGGPNATGSGVEHTPVLS